ncbi:hypothetical protein IEO21_07070 [Rhodonia placenta]|uniref:RING-type domain-containing protein n=1 Tax=Rhodonia placenta TaxID=104341 RepID=A0A8H7NYR2_9APHY|nr:hypothetical protein IEO21_07070 [Postia placenta]
MRRFDACALCLQRAREPVACQKGHLFCKECSRRCRTLSDRRLGWKHSSARRKRRNEAHERLPASASCSSSRRALSQTNVRPPPRILRKFDFSESTVDTLAREAEEAALRQIEREQAEALKHKLPDFWLPSLTPTYASSGPPASLADVKLQTTCRGGNPPHHLTRKTLIPVHFIFDTSASTQPRSVESTPSTESGTEAKPKRDEEKTAICPSCKKVLSNSALMNLMKPCGHVVCKTCTDTLVKPAKQCIQCDVQLADKDIIELAREGTGYAAGGLAETSKKGVAFQG